MVLYIFSTGQVLLSTLSWCSACTSGSEDVFLMYLWREMYSMSTYSSAILFSPSLLLNMLSMFAITFLPRSKRLLTSWLQSLSAVILEPKEIKCVTVSTFSLSICHEVICDPMDCNLSGSSVHGILQARILEWVAVPFSRGSSQPRDWTQFSHITGRFFTIWATREALSSQKSAWISRNFKGSLGHTLKNRAEAALIWALWGSAGLHQAGPQVQRVAGAVAESRPPSYVWCPSVCQPFQDLRVHPSKRHLVTLTGGGWPFSWSDGLHGSVNQTQSPSSWFLGDRIS